MCVVSYVRPPIRYGRMRHDGHHNVAGCVGLIHRNTAMVWVAQAKLHMVFNAPTPGRGLL